jgi:hypothetical protein
MPMSGKDNGQVCCRTIYFCVLSHLYLYNSPNYTFINGWQLSSEGLESGSYEVKLGKIFVRIYFRIVFPILTF